MENTVKTIVIDTNDFLLVVEYAMIAMTRSKDAENKAIMWPRCEHNVEMLVKVFVALIDMFESLLPKDWDFKLDNSSSEKTKILLKDTTKSG